MIISFVSLCSATNLASCSSSPFPSWLAETELWKEPPEPLLDEIAELVRKDNPYWEGSPTALVTLINVDIQPHVITRKLNVLAGRLYAEHGILFRSERVHEGRKLRLWKDNTENV